LFPLKVKTSLVYGMLAVSILLWLTWVYRLIYVTHTSDILNKDINFPPFLIAMFLFALFLRLKLPHSRLINMVAGTTLAVYLIHANRNLWEPLWKFFDIYKVHGTPWFYIFPFVIGTLVFSVCVVIELGRQRVASKLQFAKLIHYFNQSS
ncbi:MAG: hypothetical protein JWO07_392, partial [Candidatus Saccharibacteria bacterium]|nr:hypothetical protein [Candidatus Saccharibacteria bacterium]